MRIAGKTISYWWEKYGGLFAGVIACCIIGTIHPASSSWKPFIVEFPAIGMCAFGFLLTFLGIILQGNSDTITWMMSRDVLYNRFIAFNKRIVIISSLIGINAFLLLLKSSSNFNKSNVLISIFCGLLVWFIIDTIQFTRLFYVLIRKSEKK